VLLARYNVAVENPSDEWSPVDFDVFTLADYLRSFLRMLGIDAVDVYDVLDGRQLVPYQATMQRRAWARASVAMEGPFSVHRTVYRRMFGGKHAPEVAEGKEPRFRSWESSGEDWQSGLQRQSSIPVVRTFVHFSESSADFKIGVASTLEDLQSGHAMLAY